MTRPALILLSGGLDSLACVEYYVSRGGSVYTHFVDYGQPSLAYEQKASAAIAKHYGLPHVQTTVAGLKVTAGEVPGRNVFLVALSLAVLPFSKGLISLGVHAGTNYADCSPRFAAVAQSLIGLYHETIVLDLPFIGWSKEMIWNYLQTTTAPVNLSYSCEAGAEDSCGACLSCRDRGALYAR